ncbi:hypothetical protein SUGI_0874720 [Cryptomeria japonica]|nr:hypothetical protein SUGI_0874680 [Cryptomeria japonica]GLJ42257.1 hypothetical protein SUGI_0874700 [Cryptomeria japonica]GLJ42259.1 hypothetical protein SUGI_0874720 [Cryptomeria japonica]
MTTLQSSRNLLLRMQDSAQNEIDLRSSINLQFQALFCEEKCRGRRDNRRSGLWRGRERQREGVNRGDWG